MSKRAFTVLVLAVSSYTPYAVAAAGSRTAALEEVIVTARKVEESLQDTPVSVAAFGPEDLEQIGVSEAQDVAAFTPGLRIQKQSGSQDNYALAIRGVSSGETALAIDPTVGIYQDGVYIARSTGAAFDIVDLQRIEVLRGPQGTLFGRNTIGGAINIITLKPRGETAFRLHGASGNRGQRRLQMSLDTPKFGDFAARLSMLESGHHGQLKNQYNGERLADADGVAYRLALNWSPSETLTADLVYDASYRDSNSLYTHLSAVKDIYSDPSSPLYGGPYYQQAEAASGPKRRSQVPLLNTDTNETNSDIRGTSLTVDWALSESLSLKSITAYRDWRSQARGTDFGSFPVQNEGDVIDLRSNSPVPAGTFVSLFSATRDNTHHQFTQEFQLTGTAMDERLSFQAGLYWFTEKASELNPQLFVLPTRFLAFAVASGQGLDPAAALAAASAAPATATLLDAPFAYTTDNRSYAAYGQLTWNLLSSLDVTLGLRYTVDDKASTLTNNLDGGDKSTAADNANWSNLNPSLTVDYRWSEQLATYFRYATGYRSGGYNVRAQTSSAFTTPFNEENISSFELGIKADLLQRSLRINASVYRIDYEDRQIAAFEAGSGGASTNIVNAGQSTTDGFEIEGIYIPTPGLRITFNYGYLDVDYKEFLGAPLNRETGAASGENQDISSLANDNLYAPQHSWALALEYQFEPWRLGQLSARIDTTFSDEISFHPQLNFYDEADEYRLINARLTLADIPAGKDARIKLMAWGKNLENKEYRSFGIDFGVLGLAVSNYGPLRSWGLDFIYEFNR